MNGQQSQPGYLPVLGQTNTLYYQPVAVSYDGGTGTVMLPNVCSITYDAVGFFQRTNVLLPYSGMPPSG